LRSDWRLFDEEAASPSPLEDSAHDVISDNITHGPKTFKSYPVNNIDQADQSDR
jgi:hypothetical protein